MLISMFEKELALRPNCLLTRLPLVFNYEFLDFLFIRPLSIAHEIAREHGYMCFKQFRLLKIEKTNRIHFFCCEKAFNTLIKSNFFDNKASVTVFTKDIHFKNDPLNNIYNFHQETISFENMDPFLNHCIQLAEQDFIND